MLPPYLIYKVPYFLILIRIFEKKLIKPHSRFTNYTEFCLYRTGKKLLYINFYIIINIRETLSLLFTALQRFKTTQNYFYANKIVLISYKTIQSINKALLKNNTRLLYPNIFILGPTLMF